MRLSSAAAALALGLVTGCASSRPPPAAPCPATGAGAEVEHANDLIRLANLEIANLQDLQPRVKEAATREAVGRQIALLVGRRDALEADLAAGPRGAPPQARLHDDAASLDQVLGDRGSTMLQPVEPPRATPRRSDEQELVPPAR